MDILIVLCDYDATAEVWLVPVDVVTEEEFKILDLECKTMSFPSYLVEILDKWQQYKTDSNVIEQHINKVYFI